MRMNERPQRALIWLLIIAVSAYLLERLYVIVSLFSATLLLFVLSWLIALALSPLVDRLTQLAVVPPVGRRRWHLPRSLAVTLVYLVLLAVVVFALIALVPIVGPQLASLQATLPTLVGEIAAWAFWGESELRRVGWSVDLSQALQPELLAQQATTIGSTVLQQSVSIVGGIATQLFNLILILILSFYMTMDGPRLFDRVLDLLPAHWREDAVTFFRIVDRTFGDYLRLQVLQGILYGLANAALMLTFGLSYVTLASLLAGVAVLVPIFGPVLALIPPLLIAILQNPDAILPTVVGLLIVQQVLFNIIMPRVMGTSVGLHPLLVFAAILIGGTLAGVWGILLGIPFAGVLAAIAWFVYYRATGRTPGESPEPAPSPPASEPTPSFTRDQGESAPPPQRRET